MKRCLLALALSACSAPVTSTHFDTDTTYSHAIPGCDAAPPANCSQNATFSADGTAFVLLTDEANAGTYLLSKDHLDVTFTTHADGGNALSFTFDGSQEQMTNDSDGQCWTRVTTD
ncbi:MAG: hypothetical protein ABI321_19955 [Polyangia bacterium]